jgi:hypothetical protein
MIDMGINYSWGTFFLHAGAFVGLTWVKIVH